jgi:hypothetical protein
MRDFKRVLVCSDLHCGHRTGLTHPNWHRPNSEDKLDWIQSELWWRWKKEIEKLKPIDIAFWNGDLIEGRNKPSEELMTGDRNEQVIYAAHAMAETEAEVHVVSTGTTFHVGVEDFERNLRENALLAGKVKQAGAHNYRPQAQGGSFICSPLRQIHTNRKRRFMGKALGGQGLA